MFNMIKKQDMCSPYACNKGDYIVPITQAIKSEKKIEELLKVKMKKGIYAATDYAILDVLYKFGVINHYNIVLYVNKVSKLPDKMKKPHYRSNINRLIKDGAIESYSVNRVSEDSLIRQDIMFYKLSKGAYEYMSKREEKKYLRKFFNVDNVDAEEFMRTLVKNQVEINLLINKNKHGLKMEKWGINNLGEDEKIFDSVIIPVEKDYYKSPYIRLYLLPVRKNDVNKVEYLKEIIALNRIMNNRKNEMGIACCIVEHLKEMFEIHAILEEFDDMNIDHLYMLEQTSATGDCLSKLYVCRTSRDAHIQYANAPIRYAK